MNMNNLSLKSLEFIQITCSLRGRAKSPRPRRQVKKDRRRSYCYIENVFCRQRRHRALQSAAVEWVVWIHSIIKNKPNFSAYFTWKWRFHKKTNPIQTQFKPNQSQFWHKNRPQLWKQTQFKPNFYPWIYPEHVLGVCSHSSSAGEDATHLARSRRIGAHLLYCRGANFRQVTIPPS